MPTYGANEIRTFFPLLIKICYDSKQYLRKIYSKCITTFSTYPFSPSSITRRSWNWTPREKNALTKPQPLSPGWESQNLFFFELLMHFRVRGCHKNLSILIFIIISWWDLKKQKEVCSEFCSGRHSTPKNSKRVQFREVTPGKKTLFRNGDARANGRRHKNR